MTCMNNFVKFPQRFPQPRIKMIFDTVVSSNYPYTYLPPPNLWLITAHLFPNSSCNLYNRFSSSNSHSSCDTLGSSWLLYLCYTKNTSLYIACPFCPENLTTTTPEQSHSICCAEAIRIGISEFGPKLGSIASCRNILRPAFFCPKVMIKINIIFRRVTIMKGARIIPSSSEWPSRPLSNISCRSLRLWIGSSPRSKQPSPPGSTISEYANFWCYCWVSSQ